MLNSVWAILGTIVLGVATNLLTPYVVKLYENSSSELKKRKELKKKTFENTVKYILENSNEEIILRIKYLQRVQVTLITLAVGFAFMITNNGFLIILGFIFSLLGYYGSSKADRLGKLLEEVTKQKDLSRPEIDLS